MTRIDSSSIDSLKALPYNVFKQQVEDAIDNDDWNLCELYLEQLLQPGQTVVENNELCLMICLITELKAIRSNKLPFIQLLHRFDKLTTIGLYETVNQGNSSLFWWYLPHFEQDNKFNLSLLLVETLIRCVEHDYLELFKQVEVYILTHQLQMKDLIDHYKIKFVSQACADGAHQVLSFLFQGSKLFTYRMSFQMSDVMFGAYHAALLSSSIKCVRLLVDHFPISDSGLCNDAINACYSQLRRTDHAQYQVRYQIACMLLDVFTEQIDDPEQDLDVHEQCESCVMVDCVDLLEYCIYKCKGSFHFVELLDCAVQHNAMECFKWLLTEFPGQIIPEDVYLAAVSRLRYEMLLMLDTYGVVVRSASVLSAYEDVCQNYLHANQHHEFHFYHMYMIKKVWPEVMQLFNMYTQTNQSHIHNIHTHTVYDIVLQLESCAASFEACVMHDEQLYQIALDLCAVIPAISPSYNIVSVIDLNSAFSGLLKAIHKLQKDRSVVICNKVSSACSLPVPVVDKFVCECACLRR